MEAKAVVDKQGRLISAIYRVRQPLEGDDRPLPHMGPVIEAGQTMVELAIPDEYAGFPVEALVERLTADVQSKLSRAKH